MFRLVDICRDMQVLNISARNDGLGKSRQGFYQVKNALMRFLYLHGKCSEARLSVQEFECWDCNGTGGDWEDGERCLKCRGTGIYRRHVLYAMTFEVGGRRFRWHIPQEVAQWEVRLTETRQERFEEPKTEEPKLSDRQVRWMLLRVWIGCKLAGVEGMPPLKTKGWLRRSIIRKIHQALGRSGDWFQAHELGKLAGWCWRKRARIWRFAYDN